MKTKSLGWKICGVMTAAVLVGSLAWTRTAQAADPIKVGIL